MPLFSSRRSLIAIVTTCLFAVGILSASFLLYQEYLKSQIPVRITREEAVSETIAKARATNFGQLGPDNYVTQAQLIHVKNNGFAFVVDQQSFQDTLTIADKVSPDYEDHYVWIIKIESTPENKAIHLNDGWESWIDATTGEILLSAIDGGIIPEE